MSFSPSSPPCWGSTSHAGFSFERGRVFWAGLFSLLGIYFCLTTLADQHDLATTLLYGFAILICSRPR